MSGLRGAALALHALEPADRAWLLERLTPAQRNAVDPLLEELVELGIPADTRLVDEALRTRAQVGESFAHKRVASLLPQQAAQVLQDEPAPFVAGVLALAAWPWAQGYIEGLDASKRRRLLDAMHDLHVPASAALRTWLIEALAARVDTDDAPTGQPARLAWSPLEEAAP